MIKRVFLISGFELNRTAAYEQYAGLRNAIKARSYDLVPVNINWKHHTMTKFVDEFQRLYRKKAGEYNIIIGNSFGAMAAMIGAPELKPDKIILCSLSPFFQEDIPRFSPGKTEKWFGKRRVQDFLKISAKTSAEQINRTKVKSILFYGEQEKKMYKKLVKRVRETAKDLKDSQLTEIPNAPHSFKDPAYVLAITQVL